MADMIERSILIVGGGPRGISTLERLGAHIDAAGHKGPLTVHLIDDIEVGAGSVWRTDQTRTLCMNTLAHGVTLFTEPGASVRAPVRVGPTLHEWVRLLRGDRPDGAEGGIDGPIPPDHVRTWREVPTPERVLAKHHGEITGMRAHSHPSRALYGEYLRWCLAVTRNRMPATVNVVEHLARVRSVAVADSREVFTLDTGQQLVADAAALALGWLSPAPDAEERAFAAADTRPDTVWVAPGNPVEQPVDRVPSTGEVLVRGLGMGFFDVMALLTINRGGSFTADPTTRSGLRYLPSGREPHLVVSSGRGWPYLAKPEYGTMPPPAHLPRVRATVGTLQAAARGPAGIDYDTEVWPAVMRDAHEAYYLTLRRVRPEAIDADAEAITRLIDGAGDPAQLREAFSAVVADSAELFDPVAEADPLPADLGAFSRAGLTAHIAEGVAADLRDAAAGADSPRKAGLAVIGAARKPSSVLGTPGRFTPTSRDNTYRLVRRLGQMAGSGPPAFRNRQLLALIDAGLVSFLGARPTVDVAAGRFTMSSPTTGHVEVSSTTLIDAWLHRPDVRRPHDPLARSLHSAGRVRPYRLPDGEDSGSPDIDPATGRLVHADGTVDPRVHVLGIPLHAVRADTTISPLPGTDALLLQETDLVAGSLLATVSAQR